MKNILLIIIHIIFLFFIFFASIFFNIKIGRIYSRRVGHISYNLDYLLNKLKKNKKNNLTFLGTDKFIANQVLLKLFARSNKLVFFSRYFFYFYKFLFKNFPNSDFLLNYNYDLHPRFALTSKEKSLLKLSKKEILIGDSFISKNKLKGKFVILHNRDNEYDKFITHDKNYHDYRNFDFKDYLKTIKFLNKKNIKVLRFGNTSLSNKFKKKIDLTDLTNLNYSDLEQIYSVFKSFIVVSCNTGFLNIATAFRKPTLMINTVPLNFQDLDARSFGSIIVPKKVFDVKNKSYFKINKLVNLKINIHQKTNFFVKKNLRIENNSSKEIADALVELTEKLKNRSKYYQKYKNIRKRLDEIFYKNKYYNLLKNELDINISYSYLKKNNFLL